MILPKYDDSKSIKQNVKDLIDYVSYNYREILVGRVQINSNDCRTNRKDILKAQADMVEAVIDEYNALCE